MLSRFSFVTFGTLAGYYGSGATLIWVTSWLVFSFGDDLTGEMFSGDDLLGVDRTRSSSFFSSICYICTSVFLLYVLVGALTNCFS